MADWSRFDRWVSTVTDTYGRPGSVAGVLKTLVLVLAVPVVLVGIVVLGRDVPFLGSVPGLVFSVGVVAVLGLYAVTRLAG